MGKVLPSKQVFKHVERECRLCGESDYALLDVHRIVPGEQGGTYTIKNSVCLCCRCHRRVHAGQVVIEGKYSSTGGYVVHYFEDGQEFWK